MIDHVIHGTTVIWYIYPSYDVITYVAQVAYTPLSQQYTDWGHGSSQCIADSG